MSTCLRCHTRTAGHTASLRSLAFFRLMHLPHHVHPTTATRARTTPAAVPPAMAATGTSEELDCTTAPTVGRLAEPPEVTVVVRMECDGVTLTTVVTEKAVGVAEADALDALCLEEVEAVEEAGGIGTVTRTGSSRVRGRKARRAASWGEDDIDYLAFNRKHVMHRELWDASCPGPVCFSAAPFSLPARAGISNPPEEHRTRHTEARPGTQSLGSGPSLRAATERARWAHTG